MLRSLLREHTAQAHEDLHRAKVFKKLVSGELSRLEYHHILNAHWNFYCFLEEYFEEFEANSGLSSIPSFKTALEKDIKLLGVDNFTHIAHPEFVLAANIHTYSGYAYVKYGSTNGAALILNCLAKNKNISKATTGFYSMAAGHCRQAWEGYLEVIKILETQVDTIDAITSAHVCFKFLNYLILNSDSNKVVQLDIKSRRAQLCQA